MAWVTNWPSDQDLVTQHGTHHCQHSTGTVGTWNTATTLPLKGLPLGKAAAAAATGLPLVAAPFCPPLTAEDREQATAADTGSTPNMTDCQQGSCKVTGPAESQGTETP
jgi:hypothetical protein